MVTIRHVNIFGVFISHCTHFDSTLLLIVHRVHDIHSTRFKVKHYRPRITKQIIIIASIIFFLLSCSLNIIINHTRKNKNQIEFGTESLRKRKIPPNNETIGKFCQFRTLRKASKFS